MRKGFTLVELFMVILILGLISVGVFIAIFSFRRYYLQAAAERVAADLRFARGLALTGSKWIGVAFFADPVNTYFIYETDGTTDTALPNPTDQTKNYLISLAQDYEQVVILSVLSGGGNKVEFSPLGVPYSDKEGGKLTTAAVITLSNNTDQVTVRVEPETGRVVKP